MLTERDKEWLRGRKWKIKDIEILEKALKGNRIKEPYYIRTIDNINVPLAEIREYIKGEQCLHIY